MLAVYSVIVTKVRIKSLNLPENFSCVFLEMETFKVLYRRNVF
jgi:hypothetical protein